MSTHIRRRLVVLAPALAAALLLTGCDPVTTDSSLVGGDPARFTDYPYFVEIGDGLCGASVIASEWVLTAANCVDNGTWAHLRTVAGHGNGEVIVHPLWTGKEGSGHDLALIRVDQSMTAGITPIQVGAPWNSAAYAPNTPAKIMGQGLPAEGNNLVFRVANTVIHSDAYMRGFYRYGWVDSLMIGAGDASPTGCYGDQGSPLVVGHDTGHPIQVGVLGAPARECENASGFAELEGTQLAWVASIVATVPSGWGACTTIHDATGHVAATYGTSIQNGPKRDGSNYWNLTCVSNEATVLQARHSGLCGVVTPEDAPNDARVLKQGSCATNLYALIERKPLAGGYFWLVVAATGKCLAVHDASTSLRAKVVQADCGSGDHRQWSLSPTDSGYYKICNRHSEKCLDVQGDYVGPGAYIWQFIYDTGHNQQFRL